MSNLKHDLTEPILEHEGGWSNRADDPGNADGGATHRAGQ